MKNLIYLIPFLVFSSFISNFNSFELPKTWENDFSIKLYHGGGMYYGSTTIIFNENGGIYNVMDKGKENIKKFTLSEKDKIEILKKLQILKVDSIKTKSKLGITNDQATKSICFLKGANTSFCAENSSGNEIEKAHENNFYSAWSYLQEFAIKKTK